MMLQRLHLLSCYAWQAGAFTAKSMNLSLKSGFQNYVLHDTFHALAGLTDVYKSNTAREEAQREDIESIQNLITRLDFNGFFAAKRQAVNSAQLLSRFAFR